jgi:hypothetical protein
MAQLDALLSIPVAYRWVATLAFVGVIVGLSVTPGVERPDDNLFSWLFANTAPLAQKVLGVVLEWYQTTVPGRYGTITDILLNTVGIVAGLVIALFLL